jgi:hypothetical protein
MMPPVHDYGPVARVRGHAWFVSGHGFSRAVTRNKSLGFSPCRLSVQSPFFGQATRTAGAKARSFLFAFSAWLKPCPDTKPVWCKA